MNIFYKSSILCLLLFASCTHKLVAQEKLSDTRNFYSLTYKFGFADSKDTKTLAKNSNTVQIGKNFTVNNFLSISPIISYTHFGSSTLIKENVISAGGNISVYPQYFATLILDNIYYASKDRLFINVGLQKTINNSDHTLVFNTDLNLGYIPLGRRLTLSPNLGYQYFISSEKAIQGMGFYTIGVNFLLN